MSYQGPPGWGPPGYGPPQGGYGYAPAPMQPHAYGMLPWTCPYCRWSGPPNALARVTRMTTAGWIVFFVLLFMCFPLCFIGLGMKQTTTKCPGCGTPVGTG